MGTIAKELDNKSDNKQNRSSCPICNPPKDRVPMWKVWQWSLTHPNESVFN